MYKSQRKSRQSIYQDYDALDLPIHRRNRVLDTLPVVIVGLMLILAFAFAGNIIGRNASAHNAPSEELASMIAPTSSLSTKGPLLPSASLLPVGESVADLNFNSLRRQTVITEGKGDLQLVPEVVAAVPPPLPKFKPANIARTAALPKGVKIIPASVNLTEENDIPAPAVKRIVTNPSVPAITTQFTVSPQQKLQIVAQRRVRLAEENCLARAVYFESRSESDLGQLAVAKVVLNRVKNPDFPKTICGVVYQGSGSRNSCQFSFACDGLPDDVKSPEAWAHAKSIAQRAISNDPAVAMLGNAVNYHADYVTPKWSRTMRRLTRIGHHIFYAYRG